VSFSSLWLSAPASSYRCMALRTSAATGILTPRSVRTIGTPEKSRPASPFFLDLYSSPGPAAHNDWFNVNAGAWQIESVVNGNSSRTTPHCAAISHEHSRRSRSYSTYSKRDRDFTVRRTPCISVHFSAAPSRRFSVSLFYVVSKPVRIAYLSLHRLKVNSSL